MREGIKVYQDVAYKVTEKRIEESGLSKELVSLDHNRLTANASFLLENILNYRRLSEGICMDTSVIYINRKCSSCFKGFS